MTTDWVQGALLPFFILLFWSVSSSPGGRVTSFLRGEWTKEGLGRTGNQGLPIYSITDFEREGAGQDSPSALSSLSPPTFERSQRKLLFQRMSGREGRMNERSRYSRELNQCFWRGEERIPHSGRFNHNQKEISFKLRKAFFETKEA